MSTLNLACIAFAVIGLLVGAIAGIQLYRWERLLRNARVSVYYRNKPKMTPRLLDWLLWANKLEADKAVKGQVLYQLGGTTILIRKPPPRGHGKTKTRTIKGDPHA